MDATATTDTPVSTPTPLYLLPSIVKAPGRYVTRCGEVVDVTKTSSAPGNLCRGVYPNGVREGWHHTGRIFSGRETDNDIVGVLVI